MRSSPLCRIPASQLARCLSGTIGAASGQCVRIDVRCGMVAFVVRSGNRVYAAEADVEQSVDDADVMIHASSAKRILAVARRHGDRPAQLMRCGSRVQLTVGGESVIADPCHCESVPWRDAVPRRMAHPTKVLAADFLKGVSRGCGSVIGDDRLQVRFSRRCVSFETAEGRRLAACPALGTADETVLRVDPSDLRGWFRALDPSAVVTVDPGDGRVSAMFSHEDSFAVVPVAGGCCAAIEEAA